MDTPYNSLSEKNIHNAELFVKKKGVKHLLIEYIVILGISFFLLFFGSYFSQYIGQILIKNTKINVIDYLFKMLPLGIFAYIWIKYKFSFKEVLGLFGLYEVNYYKTIKNAITYFVFVGLLLVLLTTIFMNPPMYISSKLAKAANAPQVVLQWKEPLISVFNEYYKQIYQVAIREELLFRGYVQYFSYFILLYLFKNIIKWKGQPFNKYLTKSIIFIIPITLSVLVFILFHAGYLRNSLQISSSMYSITFIIYLFGAVISSLIIYKTGNLWLAIFFHAAWNALQFISTSLIVANYQVIITFLANVMLSQGAPKELVDGIVKLIVGIVS